jgi:hypothetical protein
MTASATAPPATPPTMAPVLLLLLALPCELSVIGAEVPDGPVLELVAVGDPVLGLVAVAEPVLGTDATNWLVHRLVFRLKITGVLNC